MANYLRPGVFIEESLRPLTASLSAPGDAFAAFVGTHPKGPTLPTLITSWSQFLARYGSFSSIPTEYLAHAVYQFFNNGGRNAYIVRAANANAVVSSVTLMDVAGTPAALLTVTAKYVGVAGNSFFVTVEKSDSDATGAADTRFNLLIHEGSSAAASIVERYFDLSMDPADSRYALPIVNSPEVGSTRVTLTHAGAQTYALLRARPAVQAGTVLTGGSDGTGTPALDTAALTLESVTEKHNLVLSLPGVTGAATLNPVITWASGLGSVFVVVDGPAFATSTAATVTAYGAIPAALAKSSYAAVYGPWTLVNDPATSVNGSVRTLPPSGAVVGHYLATDARRGVQKPPAGVDNVLNSVLALDTKFLSADLDVLNQKGVNVIKNIPGIGFCIFGARTLSNNSSDRYISIRRVLMAVKRDLLEGTRFAVFEPNEETLWDRLEGVITDYLTTLQQIGMLKGNVPSQGFFVKVDSENNTTASIASGEVNIEVGLALLSPAEFVVIKIGQYSSGGSAATEIA